MALKKQKTTHQIICDDSDKNNIIVDSFANATSNDIFTTFEVEHVTDEMKQSTLLNHGPNIEVISSSSIAAPATATKKLDEFDIFGNFVAEVTRNMNKPKSRILQMNIMKLIAEAENES